MSSSGVGRMDGYGTDEQIVDEYDALNDPRQVMMEVLELISTLRQASTRLGDAIVAGGLSARDWRSRTATLSTLTDQLPDVTVDDLITRLAEFGGLGPDWLHGGRAEIAHFNEEVEILYGVLRPLRVVAQRLRMLPVSERSDWPLERALGDARVGLPLDQTINALRDLGALAPYIMPLSSEDWLALERPAQSSQSSQQAQLPPMNATAMPSSTVGASTINNYAADGMSSAATGSSAPAPTFTRLRDFVPERETVPLGAPQPPAQQSPSLAGIGAQFALWLRVHLQLQRLNKWIIIVFAIVTLVAGIALLSLAVKGEGSATSTHTPLTYLVVAPTHLAFACAGKGATLSITLRNTSATPLNWSIKAPAGMSLSATHGTLKPGATTTLQAKVTSAKAAQGSLTFTSNNGSAAILYTVKCA